MALHIAMGALYPCAPVVRDILKPEPGVEKEILDLGQYIHKCRSISLQLPPHPKVPPLDYDSYLWTLIINSTGCSPGLW